MDENGYTHFKFLHELSTQHRTVLTTFNSISTLVNASSNAFLLYTVRKFKLGKIIYYRFVAALAISDLLFGATIQPLFSVMYAGVLANKLYARAIYLAVEVAALVLCQFSALMIILISLDRYLHMKHLTLYSVHMTRRRGSIYMLCNVSACILLALILTMASLYGFYTPVLIGFVLANIFMVGMFVYFYVTAYLSVRKRVAAMEEVNNTSQTISRADMQFAKCILVIMASVALRYIPYFVFAILVSVYRNRSAGLIIAYFWSIQLVFLGIFIHTVIIFGLNRKLRNFVSSKLRRQIVAEKE